MIDYPNWFAVSTKTVRNSLTKQAHLDNYKLTCTTLTEEFYAKWSSEESVPLFKSMSHMVISFMIAILMGEEFFRKHEEELVPMMAQLERDFQDPVLRALPWSLWGYSRAGAALQRSDRRFSELVEMEMKTMLANPESMNSRTDYFANLVAQLGDRFSEVYGTHILTVVFGGHANMAMTIPWLFLHARRSPGALERIRSEAILSPNAQKPFLEACLRETGRLYTNISVMRVAQKDNTKVGKHAVPKGTIVVVSPAATQRAEDWGSDAGSWKPERFLKKGAYAGWFQKAEFVQFGLGQHACPGEKMARMLIFDVVLRIWMKKYDVEVVNGLDEGYKGVDGVGAEGSWTEENFGTPSVRGEDVQVRVRRRAT